MTGVLPLAEYDRLAHRLRAAWVHLNAATDTSEAAHAVAALRDAWRELEHVDRALSAPAGDDPGARPAAPEDLLARHHIALLPVQADPAATIRRLVLRAGELAASKERHADNTHDADLIHAAIPVIWRVVRGLRHELRRLRPWAYYRRACTRTLKTLALLWLLVRLTLPWGCWITYFNRQFEQVRGCSVALQLEQNCGKRRPSPLVHRHHWSARWQGVLNVPQTADYDFASQSNDGLRLWIDGELIIDNWKEQDWPGSSLRATRRLNVGRHKLRAEFFNDSGNAAFLVQWGGGPIPPNTVIGFPYLLKY